MKKDLLHIAKLRIIEQKIIRSKIYHSNFLFIISGTTSSQNVWPSHFNPGSNLHTSISIDRFVFVLITVYH